MTTTPPGALPADTAGPSQGRRRGVCRVLRGLPTVATGIAVGVVVVVLTLVVGVSQATARRADQ